MDWRKRNLRRLIWGLIIILLVALYFFFDPSQYGWFPQCIIRWLTGFDCPACGAQRMMHELLHGDIVAAFFYNPFLLLFVLPIVTLYVIAYLIPHGKATRFKAIVYHPILILLIIVVAHLWWVFRNTELWLNIVAEYS